ncbi:MAG: hypothetical protein K2M04_03730, partial [Muribaculaceae bacterium]|nr:hypothetical protein [Muribaculaceae bacterium]
MKSLFPRLFFLAVGLSLIVPCVSARVADDAFMFRHLDVHDGLSNNQVTDVFKDSNGLMWIATASGLNRFDGYRVHTYMSDPDDTTSLRSNYIHQIQEDIHGNLWLRDQEGYILMEPNTGRVDRNMHRFLNDKGIKGNPSTLRFDPDFNLWVASDDGYLYSLSPNSESARLLPMDSRDRRGTRITDIAATDNSIVLIDDAGQLQLVDRQQFNLRHTSNDIPESDPSRPLTEYKLRPANENAVWVFSKDGLWKYDLNTLEVKPFDINRYSLGDFVKDIKVDKIGRTWIALDNGGLLVLNTDGSARHIVNDPYNDRSLANDNTTSIYIGNGGTVWVGTYKRGVSYYNDAMYKFRNKPFPDVTTATMKPDAMILYVGTDADGLIEWNLETGETKPIVDPREAGKRPAPIIDIFVDHSGRVWIGTFGGGGLKNYNPATGKWDYISTADGLAVDQVWAITESDDNRLWIGTLGKGIQVFNPETRTFERTYNMANSDMRSDYIASMRLAFDGSVIIAGTSVGVDMIDLADGSLRHFDGNHAGNQKFSGNNINQVMQDSRQLIWVATQSGLDVYDPKTDTVHHIDFGAKVKSPFVLGVVEDSNHQIWTAVGGQLYNVLVDFDPRSRSLRYNVLAYNEMDGLEGYDFNQRTLVRLPGDRIGAGGLDGINYFAPAEIKSNNKAPYVFLTDLLVNNKLVQTITGAKRIELEPDEKSFTVCFTTDDYVIPAATTFYYMLDGYDDDWVECAPDIHQVTYTNLNPGKYRLRIKATNRDGIESSDEATLDVVVRSPWYLSGLMKTLYVILALLFLFFAVHWLRRGERRRLVRREAALRRQREEEIANMRYNFISNVSHELRSPLTLIISPLEKLKRETTDRSIGERYDMILTNARRLQRLINELLDFRKIQEHSVQMRATVTDIVPFVRSVTSSFAPLAAKKNVLLSFATSVDRLTMEFDVDLLEQALSYLITNGLKFSPVGGKVTVDTSRRSDKFIIRITDDGAGIPDDVKEKLFERMYQTSKTNEPEMGEGTAVQLMLVKEYVELQGGNITVEDNPNGSGTRFIIALPINGETETEAPKAPEAVVTPRPASAPAQPAAPAAAPRQAPVAAPVQPAAARPAAAPAQPVAAPT